MNLDYDIDDYGSLPREFTFPEYPFDKFDWIDHNWIRWISGDEDLKDQIRNNLVWDPTPQELLDALEYGLEIGWKSHFVQYVTTYYISEGENSDMGREATYNQIIEDLNTPGSFQISHWGDDPLTILKFGW